MAEWWEYLEVSILPIILSGLLAYWLNRRERMYKAIPSLILQFRFGLIDESSMREEHHIWLKPPQRNNAYNTTKYEWHYSFHPFTKIQRLKEDYGAEELPYEWARANNKKLGPWKPEWRKQEDERFRDEIFIKHPIWWIFYFKDNWKSKNHCYCKRYKWKGMNWVKTRDQARRHYKKYWRDKKDNECKKCKFPEYIKSLNNGRDWD